MTTLLALDFPPVSHVTEWPAIALEGSPLEINKVFHLLFRHPVLQFRLIIRHFTPGADPTVLKPLKGYDPVGRLYGVAVARLYRTAYDEFLVIISLFLRNILDLIHRRITFVVVRAFQIAADAFAVHFVSAAGQTEQKQHCP